MKYIGKYENFESNMGEDDVDFIITKITENFPKEEVKLKISDESDETDIETSLIDMICWFEDKFSREILDEDDIINKLREYYQI
jgi:hypothetical protein